MFVVVAVATRGLLKYPKLLDLKLDGVVKIFPLFLLCADGSRVRCAAGALEYVWCSGSSGGLFAWENIGIRKVVGRWTGIPFPFVPGVSIEQWLWLIVKGTLVEVVEHLNPDIGVDGEDP